MDVGTYYEYMVGVLISGPNKGELRGSRLFFQRGVNAAEDLEACEFNDLQQAVLVTCAALLAAWTSLHQNRMSFFGSKGCKVIGLPLYMLPAT